MVGHNESWEPGGSPQEEKSKGGCLKYGAIGCLVIAVLIVIGGFFAYRATMKFVLGVTEEYTSAQSTDLPAVYASEKEINAVLDRVRLFIETLYEDTNPSPLILDSRDINILINNHPDWEKLADKAYVAIEGDLVKGEISIPLGKISSIFEGRYLNGLAAIRVSLEEGRPILVIDSMEVGGKELPREFMSTLRTQNLWEETDDTGMDEVLEKLESITVRDGNLIFTPK